MTTDPNLTMNVVTIIVGLIMVGSTIMGFYLQARTIRRGNEDVVAKKLTEAVANAKRETESAIAFRELKDSVEQMKTTICGIEKNFNGRLDRVEEHMRDHLVRISEAAASTRSAHKRIDEHRAVEHGVNGNHYPATPPDTN
jgi:hypothetical protein